MIPGNSGLEIILSLATQSRAITAAHRHVTDAIAWQLQSRFNFFREGVNLVMRFILM